MISKITTITKNFKTYEYRFSRQITYSINNNYCALKILKPNHIKFNTNYTLTYKPIYKFVNLPISSKYYYNPLPTSLD
jgi:hypothetical protein